MQSMLQCHTSLVWHCYIPVTVAHLIEMILCKVCYSGTPHWSDTMQSMSQCQTSLVWHCNILVTVAHLIGVTICKVCHSVTPNWLFAWSTNGVVRPAIKTPALLLRRIWTTWNAERLLLLRKLQGSLFLHRRLLITVEGKMLVPRTLCPSSSRGLHVSCTYVFFWSETITSALQ